ncbi:phosphatase PAP2 family protein [Haloflavibacter putidus]|uniref:Phosphatase PAP2 family protein n=1 Tax=Haloflavibacter putidus TaxID=2576776 RepID=A0A507ZNA5_9FLAO|nr:phosphatase PAP2 family protein [Haloflavibacter putidus]TQD39020.1 phosphatase PAP2 family protein [Haloflavibacter putidus]
MKNTFLLFLLLITYNFSLSAQTSLDSLSTNSSVKEEQPRIWDLAKHDASLAFGGFKHVYSRPFQWKQDDWAKAAGVVLGTAALNILDTKTNDYFQRQDASVPDLIKDFGWYFGSPQNNYGVNGGLYLVGLFTRNKVLRRTGILMITSASAAGLIQTISKTAIGRARPSSGGKFTFKPFSSEGGYHSFPSGHTILSFTTFYALSKQFDNPWAKAGLIAGGLVSPVSRLWAGAHWLTDVALSLAITVAVVDTVDKYLDQNMKSDAQILRENRNKISWRFQLGAGSIGIRGVF